MTNPTLLTVARPEKRWSEMSADEKKRFIDQLYARMCAERDAK